MSPALSRANSVKFSDAMRPNLPKRSMSGNFAVKRNSLSLPQLTLLQDFATAGPDDTAANAAASGSRVRRDSIRSHASSLLRHITAFRNCYEVNFTGTRFTTRDPPILTRADWDVILPFIWYCASCLCFVQCVVCNLPHSLPLQCDGFQSWAVRRSARRVEALLAECE